MPHFDEYTQKMAGLPNDLHRWLLTNPYVNGAEVGAPLAD